MRFKKFIAYITALAVLALSFSFNIAVIAAEKPTAVIGDTVCNGSLLEGNYTYTGSQKEGDTIFRWYISDDFFDKGELVNGADGQTFVVNNSTNGKFITFAVVPVDVNGAKGDEVCADPVMQNQGYYESLDSSLPDSLESTVTSTGYVSIVSDPTGEGKALAINKPSNSSFKTEARMYFDKVTSSKSVVDAYVYATGINGKSKIFGVYDDAYGSVIELSTDASGNLYYRGGNAETKVASGFDANVWNHIVIDIFGEAKTVNITINDNVVAEEIPWRFVNDGYNNVATMFNNYGNGGTVYIKNLCVMNLMGGESAEADMNWLETQIPEETISDIVLPDKGTNGSTIYWKASEQDYITADGKVTRPAYGDGDAEVVMTAYVINGSTVLKKEFIIIVTESTIPPEAQELVIAQNGSRPVIASYTYYDEEMEAERGSSCQWYVENENGEYVAIEGANDLVFIPTKDYDGKNIKVCITVKNAANVVGVPTYSAPLKYVYYDTQTPVAQITEKTITGEEKFEIAYKYVSPDYIPEGDSIIEWSKSATLFGEYTVISGENSLSYKPTDKTAYYQFSLTPVDAEGNAGEPVVVGPFTYAEIGIDAPSAVNDAINTIILPEETNVDLELPLTSKSGAYITWISSDESVLSNSGKITRPEADKEDVTVTVTMYAVYGFETKMSTMEVIVKKKTTAPVLSDYTLYQEGRPIKISYTYTDAEEDEESGTLYEWYVKPDADSEFTLIEGANGNMYAPAKEMDGYIFIAKITPSDATITYGEQVTTPEYTYVYQTPAKPSATPEKIGYGLSMLTGNYVYENADGIPEGESEYRWYVSKKLLEGYELIEGENDATFMYSSDYNNKYIKFEVIPKDIEGNTGDAVLSAPALISVNAPDTFDAGYNIAQTIDTSSLFGGTVKVVEDPADASNTALRLQRTSKKANEQSRIAYKLPTFAGASEISIEADVYASSDVGNGTWEMFYICGANINQAYKLWVSGNNMMSRGGTLTKPDGTQVADSSLNIAPGAFTKDTWHHIKVVLDLNAKRMKQCFFNGQLLQEDLPFRNGTNIEYIYSYFQNSYTGTGYIDNISVTPAYDYTDYAKADANAITFDADLDAVISNLRLPSTGSINGSTITWESSDEEVISTRGKVTRPQSAEGDKKVTLTAHAVKGNDYYIREIEVNVMRILSEEEIVEYDKEKLNSYDNLITDKDISLPAKGVFGASYTWKSLSPDVVSDTGKVTQTENVQKVQFEVEIKNGTVSHKKIVEFIIAPVTGANLVINGGVDASSAKAQYPASNAGDGDYSTSWESLPVDTAPSIMLDMGKVKDVNKLYIADGSCSASSVKVSYSKDKSNWTQVDMIKGLENEPINMLVFEKVSARYVRIDFVSSGTARADEIRLIFDATDSDKVAGGIEDITLPVGSSVTDDFNVTTQLSDGTKINWTSSNEDVLYFVGSKAVVKPASSDKSVTITATVISGDVSESKIFSVVVKGKGSSSSGGGGGGGSSSGGKTSGGVSSAMGVGAPVVAPAAKPEASTVFGDIADVPWAVEAINNLASIGVVNGTSATTFEPGRSITREEFAAILYRGFGFDKVQTSGSFSDVNSSDWYYEAVMQFSAMGIINGVGDGVFGTGRTITRQDMAVMIYRAAKAANAQFAQSGESFADSDSIASYALEAVSALSGANIVNGVGGGNFNPAGNATRAEATVILSRIMNYIK